MLRPFRSVLPRVNPSAYVDQSAQVIGDVEIGDEDLQSTLANIRDVLKDDGVLFTTDPCYREGQSPIAKWLLDNDRGEFIRDEDGYNKVLGNAFARVKLAIREDLSRLPYTFAIGVMQK